jgi:hypothetical protein
MKGKGKKKHEDQLSMYQMLNDKIEINKIKKN